MVRPLGIEGAVVVEASGWVEDNQWVLDLAKNNPVIVGLVGHLEPGGEGFGRNLSRFSANPLFRGIRLNGGAITGGVARAAFLEDLQRLADAGLMLDAIGNATMVRALIRLADRIPKLRIAIDHMPAEPPGWRDTASSRAALRELAKRPQVYCKVSGVLQRVDGRVVEDPGAYRGALDELWEMFGAERVMYGSNWPVSERLARYPAVFHAVREYANAKGAAPAARFFSTNSRDCYRWIERG
jgi:predicted TIM-barrel fold metal-dependent hydrolase